MKALILLLLCSPVLADDLVYQSQTLTGTASTLVGTTIESSEPINDVYTITVTVSGPLASNLNMQAITPQSWVVTCQNCLQSLSSSPTGPVGPNLVYMAATAGVFLFSTDSTGKITAWNFALSGNSTVTIYGELASTWSGSFSSNSTDIGVSEEYLLTDYQITTSGPKGTWTQSSLSNPPSTNVEVRTCYSSWAPPSNTMGSGIAPNANGSGEECGRPIYFPSSWYIKTTTDGGKTFEWQTLASLGLGKPT